MKDQFPLTQKTTYLDFAGGSLKPKVVVDAIAEFYLHYPVNPHAGDSKQGILVHQKIDETRRLVADLVKSKKEEVIFTSGTTQSLNWLAEMFLPLVSAGDEIILAQDNHASNILPWVMLANKAKAKLKFSADIFKDLNEKTKIVSYAQTNNTFAKAIDPKELHEAVKKVGAYLVNDSAQAVTHGEVELAYCDAIAISSNKVYGPTGSGALIVKQELLDKFTPVVYGGGAFIDFDETSWKPKEGIDKFEPGTPNTAGIIGLGAGIKFFQEYRKKIDISELEKYCFDELSKINKVKMLSAREDSIIIFSFEGKSPQDIVSYLGNREIIIRGGRMCAKKAFDNRNLVDAIRVSLGLYNDKKDIDTLIEALKNGGDFLDV